MTDGTLEYRNICVVSDSREHSTVTVHAFWRVVIPYLQTQFSDMKKSTILLTAVLDSIRTEIIFSICVIIKRTSI